MVYITDTIKDQWFCLNPAERYCCWFMAAAMTTDQTCVDTVTLAGVFFFMYPADYVWREQLFYDQFGVPKTIGTEEPCIGVVVMLDDVPFLPELLDGVIDGSLPSFILPKRRCRAVKGFP